MEIARDAFFQITYVEAKKRCVLSVTEMMIECSDKKISKEGEKWYQQDKEIQKAWQIPTHPVTTATLPSSVNRFIVGVILETTVLSNATAFRVTSSPAIDLGAAGSDSSTMSTVRSATTLVPLAFGFV